MEYIIYGVEVGCLVLFLVHKSKPLKWITEMDLGILRVILPVLFIGGMIWGIADRKPFDYGLSWADKEKAVKLVLQSRLEEIRSKEKGMTKNIHPPIDPDTEFSIPLQHLLEGNHGRFF
tara:strand:- start:543 stop:899 length:357 start_codon:yes stop_codon:yes gene_type:complete